MNETEFAVKIFILLLLVASAVAMATKWIRIPYTLALVIIGLIISPMHFLPVVHISPDLILLIFLPALLFEAAWNLNLEHLRKDLVPILTLAVAGVSVSLAVVGIVLRYGAGLSWSSALLFGAMISATDPVSVLALFKKFGLPPRLLITVEGESLLNDGTAAVLFRIIAGLVTAGTAPGAGELVLTSVRQFGLVVFGGVAVGAVIGMLASMVTSHFDDRRLEITLTTLAAYGAYLLSDSLHVSGVIAVLIAGLVLGNYGRRTGMSPTTQIAVTAFWEYMAFVANSLVFLLIGLDVRISDFFATSNYVYWGIAATLIGRGAAVYPLLALTNRITDPIPLRWCHVLFWGGLRGSLSIALVLSLPTALPGRSQLVTMVFGAVIFSLLIQGLSLGPLLARLKFSVRTPGLERAEIVQAQMACAAAALERLERLRKEGMVPRFAYENLRSRFEEAYAAYSSQILDLRTADAALEEREESRLRRALIEAKKSRLVDFKRSGAISEEVFRCLESEFNKELHRESKDQ
ncbi:MAG: Na+/H+ antiporter [Bryobacteraceae bacterium]